MLEDGPRGVSDGQWIHNGDGDPGVEDKDLATYGINWDAMDDEQLMEHHYENNPPQLSNPFETAPPTLSEVTCTPPSCPLLALGAEGVLPSRQIESFLRVFKQFTHTLPSRQVVGYLSICPPL